MTTRTGQCLCGRVHYQVCGEPIRIGICRCTDCSKESGAVFTAFAVWPRGAFSSDGAVAIFEGRSFCPTCGSRLFNMRDDEAEIRIGTLDGVPTDFTPTYEVWIERREHWLAALADTEQFEKDRIE